MVQYWDYGTASTTAGNFFDPGLWGGTATSTASSTSTPSGRYYYYNSFTNSPTGTAYANNYVYYNVVAKEYLVEAPAHWGEPEIAAYTRLVNDETNTGFKVTMVISGDIKITDPNVERRSMADFVPLLKHYASKGDREKIEAFFAMVPASAPPVQEPTA